MKGLRPWGAIFIAAYASTLLATLPSAAEQQAVFSSVREVAAPVRPGSRAPNLYAAADGRIFMSWLQPLNQVHFALRFASWNGTRWSAAQTIATSDRWFINWADIPSIVAFPDGRIAAHWLKINDESAFTYAYDINIAVSADGGSQWTPVMTPHRDGTPTQHGFVSMLPAMNGGLMLLWLDGRNYVLDQNGTKTDRPQSDRMTLRFALRDREGRLTEEAVLDENVCSCCQTAIAKTPSGAIVAYRDRSADEVRDIAVIRYEGQRWTKPKLVHGDGWQIAGCPVNGPAIAAQQDSVAVAWFTAAQNESRVNIAFSKDAGRTFGTPFRVDADKPAGRTDVILLPDGDALVGWLAYSQDDDTYRVRRVSPDGNMSAATTVSLTKDRWPSGFPQMVRSGKQVLFAWTEDSITAQGEDALIVRTFIGTLGGARNRSGLKEPR